MFGDPEGGKTWVCLAAAAEALQSDGRVLVVDLDHNGAAATIARLVALGAPSDALRDRGRFLFTAPEDRVELMTVIEDARGWFPTIAVVDSIGELLPLFGSSSNSADEFTIAHSRVLKPLAKAGAAVLAVDHLAKGFESRSFGPSGTGAKRRAIGGVSLRVKVKDQFTPGKGGSAVLTINKDRHGGLRQYCPTGDREPLAGTFVLHAFDGGVLEWEVKPPADGERNPDEAAPANDVEEIAALDPPPRTVDDARERLRWNKQRTANAMREWRKTLGNSGSEEP
ncbi:recombinase RecA [Rhodococcus pyridinivorans]|uniref:recombinase RecA n=1 Tax=Rhodococcus pyridinivorans TaxID=103816 RepID=UPI0022835BC4|nr:recombinase RecA [Rhodococcus pyridinivorans]